MNIITHNVQSTKHLILPHLSLPSGLATKHWGLLTVLPIAYSAIFSLFFLYCTVSWQSLFTLCHLNQFVDDDDDDDYDDDPD